MDGARIPLGFVPVVVELDRLSRPELILVQAQFAQIINADITVVTASDGNEYNRAGGLTHGLCLLLAGDDPGS